MSAPQDQVEALIRQVAAENDLEITDKLVDLQPGQSTLAPGASVRSEEHEKEDQLSRRFCFSLKLFAFDRSEVEYIWFELQIVLKIMHSCMYCVLIGLHSLF